jgi:hypothetical protein
MANVTRFGRVPRQKIIWEASQILPPTAKVKRSKRSHVQVLETRPASPSAPPVVHELAAEPQPNFIPPIPVENEPFQIQWIEQEPITLFLQFFGGFASLEIVCAAANVRAESQVFVVNYDSGSIY